MSEDFEESKDPFYKYKIQLLHLEDQMGSFVKDNLNKIILMAKNGVIPSDPVEHITLMYNAAAYGFIKMEKMERDLYSNIKMHYENGDTIQGVEESIKRKDSPIKIELTWAEHLTWKNIFVYFYANFFIDALMVLNKLAYEGASAASLPKNDSIINVLMMVAIKATEEQEEEMRKLEEDWK